MVSCKSPEARRPVQTRSGSFITESAERNKKLYKEQVISSADFDASLRAFTVSELSVDAAKYQLRSAEANLDEARKNLKRTTIQAPASGTISKLNQAIKEQWKLKK